jgi:hypothetical protein
MLNACPLPTIEARHQGFVHSTRSGLHNVCTISTLNPYTNRMITPRKSGTSCVHMLCSGAAGLTAVAYRSAHLEPLAICKIKQEDEKIEPGKNTSAGLEVGSKEYSSMLLLQHITFQCHSPSAPPSLHCSKNRFSPFESQ